MIRITLIVGICGTRRLEDKSWCNPLSIACVSFIHSLPQDHTCMVVSGGAPGIDTIATDTQRSLKMPYAVIPYFSELGPKGGFDRNDTLVDFVHEVYAFWNLVSRGTKDTIYKAHEQGKLRDVYGPTGEIVELFK